MSDEKEYSEVQNKSTSSVITKETLTRDKKEDVSSAEILKEGTVGVSRRLREDEREMPKQYKVNKPKRRIITARTIYDNHK